MSAGIGILVPVPLQKDATDCMSAILALKLVNRVNSIRLPCMKPLGAVIGGSRGGSSSSSSSSSSLSCSLSSSGVVKWDTVNFIEAHLAVKASGKYNFEGCRIPIPTQIRYDRIKEALGDEISSKDLHVLSLLQFGMPVDCNPAFGVKVKQKNHFSAVSFKESIDDYFKKGVQSQEILGPFKQAPLPGLCFSPLMSVPKDVTKR